MFSRILGTALLLNLAAGGATAQQVDPRIPTARPWGSRWTGSGWVVTSKAALFNT